MPRNLERDELRMQDRKERLIKAGFKLFSQNSIEQISLQQVAEFASVPISTLYKYYLNKINLVVAISAYTWSNIWKEYDSKYKNNHSGEANAYELIEYYCDVIIDLYKNNPTMLCFSSNYKTYISRENVEDEVLKEQLDVLAPINELFHAKYLEAKTNNCIRNDISEKEIFSTIAMTMLGMAERYAQGLVWPKNADNDYTQELNNLKEMMLNWVKP